MSGSVTPAPGTTGLTLFLRADSGTSRQPTVDDYAGVSIQALAATSRAVVLAEPLEPSMVAVRTIAAGFDPGWIGPRGTRHVLVDGLGNGWLGPVAGLAGQVRYGPATLVRLSWEVSGGAGIVVLALGISLVVPGVRRRWTRRALAPDTQVSDAG